MTSLIIRRHLTNKYTIDKKEVFRSGQTKSQEESDSIRSSVIQKTGQNNRAAKCQLSSEIHSPCFSPWFSPRYAARTSHETKSPLATPTPPISSWTRWNSGERRTTRGTRPRRGDGAPYLDYCVCVNDKRAECCYVMTMLGFTTA